MGNIESIFGSMVFSDTVMRSLLPHDTYEKLQKTIQEGRDLDRGVADVVANAMKDWAIAKGATHFTHWFQPLTGVTAEKHDAFSDAHRRLQHRHGVLRQGADQGRAGRLLLPLRRTARHLRGPRLHRLGPHQLRLYQGQHAVHPHGVLLLHRRACWTRKRRFCAPWRRSTAQALRVLQLFGHKNVQPRLRHRRPGAGVFPHRPRRVRAAGPTSIYTGRTLFGARPTKGQEMDDQYFGAIKTRVSAFMQRAGRGTVEAGRASPSTEHNEVAPAQHELAPVFTTANIATDHNQLTMEMMKKVAVKHGLVCLLHEKPFAGVNGSGKHNNWSMSTDTGMNLLEPGKSPAENAQFLLFLAAVMHAVDEHQDLLRISVGLGGQRPPPRRQRSAAGHRFHVPGRRADRHAGGHRNTTRAYDRREKPLYEDRRATSCRASASDTTDRNRTSPFAFTGNKFEFRMLGSSVLHRRRQHRAQHRRGRRPCAISPTSWKRPSDFERGAATPHPRESSAPTSASSSTATTTPPSGWRRPKSAGLCNWPLHAPTPCPT